MGIRDRQIEEQTHTINHEIDRLLKEVCRLRQVVKKSGELIGSGCDATALNFLHSNVNMIIN